MDRYKAFAILYMHQLTSWKITVMEEGEQITPKPKSRLVLDASTTRHEIPHYMYLVSGDSGTLDHCKLNGILTVVPWIILLQIEWPPRSFLVCEDNQYSVWRQKWKVDRMTE
jgi:hypothetical protein